MAEQKTEHTYVVPLRDAWRNKASYKRTRAAVQEVKRFVAKHMKLGGDVDRVRIDVHLNNELWFRGSRKPPARIEVKAKKEGDHVLVTLAHEPAHLAFAKTQRAKRHKKAETKAKAPEKEKTVEKKEEEKKNESEKEQSVAIANEKIAEKAAKAEKHTTKVKTPKINRMALQK